MSSQQPTTPDALNPAFSAKGLREAVRHGSRRTLFAQLASHVVSLVVLASLYHLVTPGDFGLIGMALPVIMFLRSLYVAGHEHRHGAIARSDAVVDLASVLAARRAGGRHGDLGGLRGTRWLPGSIASRT